jgi:2-keto-4-pentenoate hydratase/2-oxohepta-3-ene-1,7-dioic acid hydratase in catechol pathway
METIQETEEAERGDWPIRPEFLAIGLNYAEHVAETDRDKPQFAIFFNKQSSCVNGPYDPIHMPRVSTALDYEDELGFVIGRRCDAGIYS